MLGVSVGPFILRASGDVTSALTLTSTVDAGQTFDPDNMDRFSDAVLAANLTGLAPDGLIAEAGGGVGAYCGYDADGKFMCGFGGSAGTTGGILVLDAVDAPQGDGRLVVEFALNGGVTVWWRNALIGANYLSTVTQWAGGNTGVYLTSGISVFDPPQFSGRIETPATYTTATPLEYYAAQRIT